MELEKLKEKLKDYKKEDIIITEHADIQAIVRQINLNEVKHNILNPDKLVYVKEERSKTPNEEKYDCYFAYSKHLYHRYILVLNRVCLISH